MKREVGSFSHTVELLSQQDESPLLVIKENAGLSMFYMQSMKKFRLFLFLNDLNRCVFDFYSVRGCVLNLFLCGTHRS